MGSTLLTTGGVLAAFFAGGVALFAPCCIVFLAPSYLAAAVKNRLWRLLPLTFVFAAGLVLVLLPITLGVSLLAAAIARYHSPLYYAGGVLMFALAAYSLTGRMWSLPSVLRAPDTRAGDGASFFALGVFSGVASSCCAPVLAGVMTLSALSGSPAGAAALGLAYVFGMTFPLFVMALAWDRLALGSRSWMRARPLTLHLGRLRLHTNTVNTAVAAVFAAMGGFILYLAGAERMTSGPSAGTSVGQTLVRLFTAVDEKTGGIPEPLLGLGLLALAGTFVVATLRGRRAPTNPVPPQAPADPSGQPHHCHSAAPTEADDTTRRPTPLTRPTPTPTQERSS